VEATSGGGAARFVREAEGRLAQLGELFKTSPREVVDKVTRALDALRETQAVVESLRTRTAVEKAGDLVAEAEEIGGIKVVAAEVDAGDQKALREIGDKVRQKLPSGVVLLGARRGGKVSFLVTVSPDLVKRFHAGNLAKSLAERVGGRGGGRPDRAEAGGSKPDALPAALEEAVALIRTKGSPSPRGK
jgi:alanyl-tRNA synthetase